MWSVVARLQSADDSPPPPPQGVFESSCQAVRFCQLDAKFKGELKGEESHRNCGEENSVMSWSSWIPSAVTRCTCGV